MRLRLPRAIHREKAEKSKRRTTLGFLILLPVRMLLANALHSSQRHASTRPGTPALISQYCTFGGIVGASVIATFISPFSQVIVHCPRRAFSTSKRVPGRQAP